MKFEIGQLVAWPTIAGAGRPHIYIGLVVTKNMIEVEDFFVPPGSESAIYGIYWYHTGRIMEHTPTPQSSAFMQA